MSQEYTQPVSSTPPVTAPVPDTTPVVLVPVPSLSGASTDAPAIAQAIQQAAPASVPAAAPSVPRPSTSPVSAGVAAAFVQPMNGSSDGRLQIVNEQQEFRCVAV